MGINLRQQPVTDQHSEEYSKSTQLKHRKVEFSKTENSWEKQKAKTILENIAKGVW